MPTDAKIRRWLRERWGITPEIHERILARQEGRCAICRRLFAELPLRKGHLRSFEVDHCHDTDAGIRVRGYLCRECNLSEGMLANASVNLRIWAERAEAYREARDDHIDIQPTTYWRRKRERNAEGETAPE